MIGLQQSIHPAVRALFVLTGVSLAGWGTGCQSPYAADQGALVGGGTGAVLGAVLGEAVADNPLAGAALGAAAGTISGAAVGHSIDKAEARNRALIEAQLNRKVQAGKVTVESVIELSTAGVDDELILNHINANGLVRPPGAEDLILLKQAGVSSSVISAMQNPAPAPAPAPRPVVVQDRRPVIIRHSPPPVIIRKHYWGPPARRPRRAGFGFHYCH